MLDKRRKVQFFMGILMAVFAVGMLSCGDDDQDLTPATPTAPAPTPVPPVVNPPDTMIPDPPSQLSLLTSHNWILYETYENDTLSSSGGTGEYDFTVDGQFLFDSPTSGWFTLGNYIFYPDSTAIDMLFSGFSRYTKQDFAVLNENELHTKFTINGKNFLYKYRK